MLQKAILALALAAGTAAAAGDCKASTLDFVMLEGEASHAAIEEDIRKELAVVGIEVVPRVLNKEDFNTAMIDGDFDDLEKAEFLNCPESSTGGGGDGGGGSKKKKKSSNDDAGLVGGLIAAAVIAIAALCCIGAMAKKEKEGKPVFAPVHNPVNERVAEKA